MSEAIEGGLNQLQRDSLEIEEFIFHIIQPDAEGQPQVVFLDEVQLESRQKNFFLDRLRDLAEGTQYIFDPEYTALEQQCRQLLENRPQFAELSRQITADFKDRHKSQMAAGVFVVALVKFQANAGVNLPLVFLVKMDKSPSISYRYSEKNGKRTAIIEEVENSLNETKTAIQKSAVIDVSGHFAWNVLAFDRNKPINLTDYFRKFLGVTERQQDEVLTKSTHQAVRKWANKIAEKLPAGEDANRIAGRSLNYLTDHDSFDTETYINTVLHDQDETRKALLAESLREQLVETGIAGQHFRPKPAALPNLSRKQVYKTAEGVTISYEGDNDSVGISIDDLGGGKKMIKIVTNCLETKKG